MTTFCPQCGASPRLQDIHADTRTIQCRFCGTQYSADELVSDPWDGQTEKKKRRAAVFDASQPRNIKLREEGLTLVMDRRTPLAKALGVLAFSVFWLVVTLAIFGGMMSAAASRRSVTNMQASGSLSLFILIFVAIGLYTLIQGLYQLINTQTYRIDSHQIQVVNHPIPLPGKTIDTQALEQAYVQEHKHTSRSKHGTRTTYSYSVKLIFRDQAEHMTLTAGLPRDCALFIEQTLESYLHVEDVPVRGEYGKGA